MRISILILGGLAAAASVWFVARQESPDQESSQEGSQEGLPEPQFPTLEDFTKLTSDGADEESLPKLDQDQAIEQAVDLCRELLVLVLRLDELRAFAEVLPDRHHPLDMEILRRHLFSPPRVVLRSPLSFDILFEDRPGRPSRGQACLSIRDFTSDEPQSELLLQECGSPSITWNGQASFHRPERGTLVVSSESWRVQAEESSSTFAANVTVEQEGIDARGRWDFGEEIRCQVFCEGLRFEEGQDFPHIGTLTLRGGSLPSDLTISFHPEDTLRFEIDGQTFERKLDP